MLCLGTPKINFQYESPQTIDRLADLVRKYLPEEQENESEKEEEGQETEQSHNAFQVILFAYVSTTNMTDKYTQYSRSIFIFPQGNHFYDDPLPCFDRSC